MPSEEIRYLEHRAEQEIRLAQSARDSRVVQVHYQLAMAYLDRIHPQAGEDG